MPRLGGKGGIQRLAHAGEGGVGFEFGAPVGPFQLEGGGRQARLLAEGHHARETGVGAKSLDPPAVGVVELTALVGYFTTVCWIMNVARTPAPAPSEGGALGGFPG